MIKIEQLTEGTKATIERTGAGTVGVYPGMLLSRGEFDTLKVTSGVVTYSIDELEVKTVEAPKAVPKAVIPPPVVAPVVAPVVKTTKATK